MLNGTGNTNGNIKLWSNDLTGLAHLKLVGHEPSVNCGAAGANGSTELIGNCFKQIMETVLAQSSTSFREVVLLEYPRKGVWALAFVTSTAKGEVNAQQEEDMISIFLPTTPNPTSGFLLFVPKSDLTYLDMTVEEGVKLVISAGMIWPEPPKENGDTPEKKKLPPPETETEKPSA